MKVGMKCHAGLILQLLVSFLLLSMGNQVLASSPMPETRPGEGETSIVATIKPIAMLVKAVVGDGLSVDILLAANVSPHDYSLKFSDIRTIKQADLVIWVGPELESMLAKPLNALPRKKQLQLTALDGLFGSDGHDHGHQEHGHQKQGHQERSHDEHGRDPHLWLNPNNSILIVQAIATKLKEIYPSKAPLFERNTTAFIADLRKIEAFNQSALTAVKEKGFVVVHDGYRHFVDHYGLHQLAALQLPGGHTRGARHQGEILAMGGRISCVFTEPQLNNKQALQLAAKLKANSAELDLMGRDIALNQNSYLTFLQGFTQTFLDCLE